jgi:hypothetical protein
MALGTKCGPRVLSLLILLKPGVAIFLQGFHEFL